MKNDDRIFIVYIVLDIYPCSTGGMEIFYYKLLPKIAETENVILITACNILQSSNYRIIRIKKKILSIPGTTKYGTLFFTAITLIKLRKKIRIVHLPYTSNAGRWGIVLPLLKKIFGIHYLLHIHGGGMKPWKKFNADRSLFKNAEKLLAVSNITKNEYEKRSGREIELVYPLVPFDRVPETKEKLREKLYYNVTDKVILYVGSLKQLKAPDVLLKAFLNLQKDYIEERNLKLIFVGEGNLKESMLSKVKSEKFEKYVSFTGQIPYSEVPKFYKIADIYVITSEYEGTPKSLLEAMFNKLPIIGSDVNGINNILSNNKNALLFKVRDYRQLSLQIKKISENSTLAQHLGDDGYKLFLEKYNFQNTVNQLTQFYSNTSLN